MHKRISALALALMAVASVLGVTGCGGGGGTGEGRCCGGAGKGVTLGAAQNWRPVSSLLRQSGSRFSVALRALLCS